MHIMHCIELSLKLEPQLDLLFVILGILHIFLFEFQSELLLIGSVLLKHVIVLAHRLHILFQNLFSVLVCLNFIFESRLDLLKLLRVLVCDLGDQDAVIRLTTVLQEHLEHLPDRCDYLVIFLSRREDLLQ